MRQDLQLGHHSGSRRSRRSSVLVGLVRMLAATSLAFVLVVLSHAAEGNEDAKPGPRVRSLRVLLLSTMLAEVGKGEWGFAALVEADGHRILFDTGRYPETVLDNARRLDVDLSGVSEVVLSHNHGDHTGGLLHLRRELSKANPTAISQVHVGEGIFLSRRYGDRDSEGNSMVALKETFEATGGAFVVHGEPVELHPGIWLTGPVLRRHPERNWSGLGQVRAAAGWIEDTIPESQSLVLDTERGLVVLSGCGHAGLINTLEYARSKVREAPIHAALGGFHLFRADDEHLAWTSAQLRELGLEHFLGAHCTGIEAVFRIRDRAGLARSTCVVGAVGASFELDKGIEPLNLAR